MMLPGNGPRGRLGALALVVVGAMAVLGLHVPAATGAQPRALIDADTVSGGWDSLEATTATARGFDVNVVDGDTWKAMTQDEFAQYQLLIAGDQDCSTMIADSLMSNEDTWAPVVMGTSGNTAPGNRVLVGTAPARLGATELISDGIAFAGAQPGRTGLYLDAGCDSSGRAVSMMDRLSSGIGTWTLDDGPPCDGAVAKIASTPSFDTLTTAGLSGSGCSAYETFPTFASDWRALAVATDTATRPTCGPGGTCGEAYLLVAGSDCPTAPSVDTTVSGDQRTRASRLKAGPLSTAEAGELLVATIGADGPRAATQRVTRVTGGGLTWTRAARSNRTWGTAEVWQAEAPQRLSNVSVVATLATRYDGSLTVTAFKGAGNSVAAVATGAGRSGTPTAKLAPAGCGSLVWAAGHDWSNAANPVAATGQRVVHSLRNGRMGDSFWTQRTSGATTVDRSAVTVRDTAPTRDRWSLAAVEIPGR